MLINIEMDEFGAIVGATLTVAPTVAPLMG